MALAKLPILWFGNANTIIKGAVVGAVIGLCTEAVANALQATIAVLQSLKRGSSTATSQGDTSSNTDSAALQEELQTLLVIALESPQQLLSGRHSQTFRRVLRQVQGSSGDLPWQLIVIYQRLESTIDSMPYDELYSLFGGNPPPSPVPADKLKKIPKTKVSRKHLQKGLGSGLNVACPICLQEFCVHEVVSTLPGCQHVYHQQCVTKWLSIRGDCPVCRQVPYE